MAKNGGGVLITGLGGANSSQPVDALTGGMCARGSVCEPGSATPIPCPAGMWCGSPGIQNATGTTTVFLLCLGTVLMQSQTYLQASAIRAITAWREQQPHLPWMVSQAIFVQPVFTALLLACNQLPVQRGHTRLQRVISTLVSVRLAHWARTAVVPT
jgi:hypothetical protein